MTKVNERVGCYLEGWVEYTLFTPSGIIKKKVKNLIQPAAKAVLAKGLFGASRIDTIEAFNSSSSLAVASVVGSFTNPNVASFDCEFDELSFNGTLDEVRLQSAADGDFSILTGLSITKDNLSRLAITWSITIN